MTLNSPAPRSESDNERSSVNSAGHPEEVRGDQPATSLKREGASRSLPARIAAKISPEPNTGCWLWTARLDPAGYGQVNHEGRTTLAHLVVFKLLIGTHATEDLDHTCRQRSCVNPAHLEPVSHRENMRRGNGFAGENARKTHCKRGHEFTPANTRAHGKGNRACRACEKIRSNPLGLPEKSDPLAHHRPASVEPTDWRTRLHVAASSTGSRRVAESKSPYAVRAEGKGQLVELVDVLRRVRGEVQAGAALTDAVADGTLWGWRSRQALSNALGVPLANWDREPGRTTLERLALVERVLAECGVEAHRGGWAVSR